MRNPARSAFALVLCATLGVGACDTADPEPGASIPLNVPGRDGGTIAIPDMGSGDASLGSISVLSPKAAGIYRGSVPLEFVVQPEPGTTIVGTPTAFVGGEVIPISPGDAANKWVGTIVSFKFDPAAPAPAELQVLRIAASDSTGGTLTATVAFSFDDMGPSITQMLPSPNVITGGVIRVAASVADPAGIGKVIAFIGNRAGLGFEFPLAREARNSDVFSTVFDTRALTSCGAPNLEKNLCVVYPNVSFRAVDLLGNESVAAYDIALDNQPPLADFDPPDRQYVKVDPLGGDQCSDFYDPVGRHRELGDMPNDGCGVGQLFDLRALIEDRGNTGVGSTVIPLAKIDPNTVMAYVLDDVTKPLAVDTDGDGICDDVNPTLVPTTATAPRAGDVLAVRLRAIEPYEHADYSPGLEIPGVCHAGHEPNPPPLKCRSARMLTVTAYAGGEPSVWTVDPLNTDFCTGAQFDVHANKISDGWACIAVVASDLAGNRSISKPLRVYVDSQLKRITPRLNQCHAPPADDRTPPDCTGTYDRAAKALTATPCTSPKAGFVLRREAP